MAFKIAEAFVQLGVKGFSAVSSTMNSVAGVVKRTAGQFAEIGKQLEKIGSTAQRAFAFASAGIAGTLKLADPQGFDDFLFAIGSASIQIGRIFTPLIREATVWVQQLTNALKQMTDEQREQVLNWTKLGLEIALALSLLPKLTSVFGALATVGKLVVSVVGFLAGIFGGWVVAIAAVVGGLVYLITQFEGLRLVLADAFSPLVELWNGFTNLISPVIELAKQVGEVLANAFKKLWAEIKNTTSALFDFNDQAGQDAVKRAEQRLANIRAERKRQEDAGIIKPGEPIKTEDGQPFTGAKKPGTSDRFRGEIRPQQPQFVGIAEAFRKVQTAVLPDLSQRLQQEAIQESKRHTDILQQIKENTGKPVQIGVGA